MANHKKAPVGSSGKMKDGKPGKPELGKLHKAGGSVPTFNAARIDKMASGAKK